MTSCNPTGEKTNQLKDKEIQDTTTVKTNIVRKIVNYAGPFYQITNIGSPDIIFQEGDYSIEVEGPENQIDAFNIDIDSYVLTVGLYKEENIDLHQFNRKSPHLKVYVSCPNLKAIATCSTGGFKSVGTIHTDKLIVGCIGSGTIEMDTVITTGFFRYESTGDGDATFHHIQSKGTSMLLLSGNGETKSYFDETTKLTVDANGAGLTTIEGKAQEAELTVLGNCLLKANLDASNLVVSAYKGKVELQGKFGNKKIHQDKNAQILMK